MRGVVAMESCTGLVSLLVTVLSLCSVVGSQAGSHSLMYLYLQSVNITELPAFSRTGMLDDLQIDYYDSTLREVKVRYPWTADGLSADYQKEQKEITDKLHDLLLTLLKQIPSFFSINFIQGVWGCTQSGNMVNMILKFNIPDVGEFNCDINAENCTGTGVLAIFNDQLNQLIYPDVTAFKINCIRYLQRAVQLGKEALERQVAPEAQVLIRKPTATEGERLSCIISPFYPRAIDATWLKNGEVVSEGYKVTVLPNYNDTYWMELVIDLQGNNPNIYACHVKHSSLPKSLMVKGGSHSLMYFYLQTINITELPAFSRTGMLDDLQIDYYDSTLSEVKVKYPWTADGLSADYQKEQKEITDKLHDLLLTLLKQIPSFFSINFIQGVWGCTQSGNMTLKFNIPDIGEFSCDINAENCTGTGLLAIFNDRLNQLNYTDVTAFKINCIRYLQRAVQLGKEALERQVAPEAQVLIRKPTATEGERLSCIINPFYPRAIDATWLKNGQVVSEGYKVTVLPNYNDTYWMELVIDLQGNNPNIYACHVKHSSLPKALMVKGGAGEPHGAGPMLGLLTAFVIIFGVM